MNDRIEELTSARKELWLSNFSTNPEVIRSLKYDDLIIETKLKIDKAIDPRWELVRKWFLELKYSATSDNVEILDINEALSHFTEEEINQ